jgi:hypothetical protein
VSILDGIRIGLQYTSLSLLPTILYAIAKALFKQRVGVGKLQIVDHVNGSATLRVRGDKRYTRCWRDSRPE